MLLLLPKFFLSIDFHVNTLIRITSSVVFNSKNTVWSTMGFIIRIYLAFLNICQKCNHSVLVDENLMGSLFTILVKGLQLAWIDHTIFNRSLKLKPLFTLERNHSELSSLVIVNCSFKIITSIIAAQTYGNYWLIRQIFISKNSQVYLDRVWAYFNLPSLSVLELSNNSNLL